jgi:surface protein
LAIGNLKVNHDEMSDTNREEPFQLTHAIIEERRSVLKQLPFDELVEMFKNIGEKNSEDPQAMLGRLSRTQKNKLIDSIIEHRVKNHNPVTEERYQFVLWLFRIRKQYRRMGLFQPDFICIIFGKMMPSKLQRSDADIHEAVNAWCEDPAKATVKYGQISKWNTSLVTNMKELFKHKSDFNDDISKWNVSNVTDMSWMFSGTYFLRTKFNGDISKWNVSNVSDMSGMFQLSSFDGGFSGWDVSSVTNMGCMFRNSQFNGDISGWNVSSVTDMHSTFKHSQFDGDISGWDVSRVTDMRFMFSNTLFNGDISGWDVSSVTNMGAMFCETPFTGDISGWNVSSVTNMTAMFSECPIPEDHKPRTLKGISEEEEHEEL